MEDWFIPYQSTPLKPAKRVLIIAPHPDDEIFGCGGVACLYQQQDAHVQVLVITDGAGQAPEAQRSEFFAVRQIETNQALSTLGLPHATFWGLPDRGVGFQVELPGRIANWIQQNNFDTVFTPGLQETHPDHRACSQALLSGLAQLQSQFQPLPSLIFYEVSTPLRPNWLLDISKVWDLKKQSMQCFTSQHALQNYARHIEGLNAYRTYTLPPNVQYAEAFSALTEAELQQLISDQTSPAETTTLMRLGRVLAAAEASAQTMQNQLLAQNQRIADLNSSFEGERESFKLQQNLMQETTRIQSMQLSVQSQERAANLLQLQALNAQLELQAQHTLALKISLDDTRQELFAMQQSRWWRIGKPVRWIMLKLRKLIQIHQ